MPEILFFEDFPPIRWTIDTGHIPVHHVLSDQGSKALKEITS